MIQEDTRLNGMVSGAVNIVAGATLWLNGMIVGDVSVEKNARTYIYGMVSGDVINRGGDLEVYGVVNGRVLCMDGKTLIDPNSVVRETERSISNSKIVTKQKP